jgi:hypothetical protein
MSKGRNAVAFAAACGLLVGCATGAPLSQVKPVTAPVGNAQVVTLPAGPGLTATGIAIPVPTTSSRVTASKLVSRPDLVFKLAELQWESYQVTFLMHQPSGKEPSPVAVMSSFQAGGKAHIWLQRVAPSGLGADRSDMEIATIEHLYGLALGQNPEAGFCLTGFGRGCASVDDDYPHAELLRELSEARQRAMARAHSSRSNVPWRVVSMASAPPNSGNDDQVGVRVFSEGAPLEGATVFFNRAPHSGCKARSLPDGLATCLLVDQHGDDDAHSEDDKAPVLATFPGDVRPERVLLPTTLVMSPRP